MANMNYCNTIFNIRKLTILIILFLCVSVGADCAETNSTISNGTTDNKLPFVQQGIVMQHDCEDGSALVNKMFAAATSLNSYSCHYQMLVFKNNPPLKETGTMYFRKPRLYRVEVNRGPKNGSVAILCADGKIHGHLGGWLKFFQSSVPPDSDLAKAINGFPMAGTDFYSLTQWLVNMLKHGDSSLVSLNPIPIAKASMDTYILDMYSTGKNTNGKNQQVLIKRIYVNPHNYLPVDWEDYRNGKLWSESSWNNLQINVALPDNIFKL